MPTEKEYVNVAYLKKSVRDMKPMKDYSYQQMHMQTGFQVLDLGCGPGLDAIELAKYVGVTGSVVGIDLDEKMLREAKKIAAIEGLDKIITFKEGNAIQIPAEPESFHACRADRLLQVLPRTISPDSVIKEMSRVTKIGGSIVLLDADWASISIDFPDCDLERKMLRFFLDKVRPNGYAGRQIYHLLKQANFSNIQIHIFPLIMQNLEDTPFIELLVPNAKQAGIFTENELIQWQTTLQQLQLAGYFFACVNVIVGSGQKN